MDPIRRLPITARVFLSLWTFAAFGANPDLKITSVASPAPVSLGELLTYQITVTNQGNAAATGVSLVDTLSSNVTFFSATLSQGTYIQSAGDVTCSLGSINPGTNATVRLLVTPATIGSATNLASVSETQGDANPADNSLSQSTLIVPLTFYAAGNLLVERQYHTATLLLNGKVLVTGGLTATGATATAELYNPATGTSQFTGNMTVPRTAHAAVRLNDGRVFIVGYSGSLTNTAEIYDPNTGTFTRTVGNSLNPSIQGHSATLLQNGTVLVSGGYGIYGYYLNTADLFDPATGTFSAATNMSTSRSWHTATLLESGSVLVAAGTYYYAGPAFGDIYTPNAGNISQTSNSVYASENWRASLLGDGRVLLTSGNGTLIYDPATNGFAPAAPMFGPRWRHGSFTLPNGSVLLCGGYYYGPLQTAELYSTNTGQFTRTVDMLSARDYSAFTQLADGRVLVIGGTGPTPTGTVIFASVEMYDSARTKSPPTVQAIDASALEDSGLLQFQVRLSTAMGVTCSVDYATADGSAIAGSDYTATNGTLIIPPGVTNLTVNVPTTPDQNYEQDETLYLNLSNPTNILLGSSQAIGTILNDDSPPLVIVGSGSVFEPNVGVTNFTLPVYLSAASYETVYASYSTVDGGAIAGSDYIATNGLLTFDPGATNLTITVAIKGDTLYETNETFSIAITSVTNATASPPGVVTIISDDGLPSVLDHFTFSAIPQPQFETLPIPLTVTARDASHSVVTSFNSSVRLSSSTSNAPAYLFDFEEGDFSQWTPLNLSSSPGPYQIVPFDVPGKGFTSLAFRIAANSGPADGISRPVTLKGGVTYAVSADIAASSPSSSNGDGGNAHLQINGQDIATYSFGGIGAGQVFRTNLVANFLAPSNGVYQLSLRFDRGYLETDVWNYADNVRLDNPPLTPVRLSPFTNGVWSGNIVALSAGSNLVLRVDDSDGHFGLSSPFTVSNYADVVLQPSIAPNPARVGSNLVYTLVVTNQGPGTATSIVLTNVLPPNETFLSATSTVGTCSFSSGMVTCPIGNLLTGRSATITIVARPLLPGTVTNLAGLVSFSFDPNPANNASTNTITINVPLLYVLGPTLAERTGGPTNAQFQVFVGTPFTQTIDVDYATADGSAIAGRDYAAASGHLTFTPGVTNQSIAVTILDDTINEPAETFAMNLFNPANVELAYGGTTNCTILDNFDPLPLVSIADASVLEGNSGTNNCVFNLTLSRVSGYTVTVKYTTSNGTAISGSDFVTNGGTLSFPPGTTNLTISVGVRADTVKELDETFFVTLGNPANCIIQRAQATGTILNDDTATGQLDHFNWSVIQSPQFASFGFPVTLTARDSANSLYTGPVSNTVVLTVQQGNTNFAIVTPTNAGPFVNGVWSGTITVSTAKSNVVLFADDGAQRVGSSNPFDVLAQNALVLTMPAGTNENAGVLSGAGRVNLPSPAGSLVTVNLSSSDTSEVTVPSSVIVPAGQTNATFDITVVDDAILDGTQIATITASAGGYVSAAVPFAVYDNETATLTISTPATVAENAGSVPGTVTISSAPASPMFVSLTSSVPSRVQVPATLSFGVGQTSKPFSITISNDQILQAPTNVTITAHVQNWTDGTNTFTLTDDDTNTLAFQFTGAGAIYPENTLLVSNASVRLGGSVLSNVVVSLSSSDANTVITPPSVTVPAGSNSVPLVFTIVDDNLQNGTHFATLVATAPGFYSATSQVTVTDNDWHHFNFGALPAPAQGGVPFPFSITARDLNDSLETGYSAYVNLTAVAIAGKPVPLSPSLVLITNGQWSGNLTVPNWDYRDVRITATDSDGHAGQTGTFDVLAPAVFLITMNSSDLAYSDTSRLLYATTTNTALLTPIDPYSATVGAPISIPTLAGKLCASDGGQYIFAALNNSSNHICQFDVNSQSVVNSWTLEGNYVEDMCPVLGSPASVVVSRRPSGPPFPSPRFRGVAIYDNGIIRSNVVTDFLGANVIEASRSPSIVYGFDNETSPAGSQVMTVNASGIKTTGGWGGPGFAFYVDIFCRANLIFVNNGQIWDPVRSLQVGSYSGTSAVADDAPSGRYYLASSGSLVAYDQNTLLPVGAMALPGVSGSVSNFLRFGTNGFALRVGSTKVALVRSSLISTPPLADLTLSVNYPPLPVSPNSPLNYTLVVSNNGNLARNVVLTQTLPGNATFISATNSSGSNTVSGGLICFLQNIPPGTNATVAIKFVAGNPGLITAIASVTSDSLDPNLTNHVLKLQIPVATPVTNDSVSQLTLASSDIVWDKNSKRIFISTPNSDVLLGNQVLALDPLTLKFDAPVPMAVDPAKLAVSDNGQYLYAGINSDSSIQRVNLSSRTADLKFPTGYGGVADMAVLPGSPQTVAATAHTTFVVYDNGVSRPNVVSPGAYNFDYYMAVSGTNTLAYETQPYSFARVGIDTNGATVLNGNGLVNSFDRQIKFDAGRIYTFGGRVGDPETGVLITNLTISGLVTVAPDSQAWRIFYLSTSGSTATIHSLDITNFNEVGSITIPNISGTPSSLITWGADGLAFRTTGSQLFVIRTILADDRNNDGLPDSWQLQYFGSLNAPGSGPNDDPDHDGLTNLQEYRAGSNPLVYDSLRFVSAQAMPGGAFNMSILGIPGQTYALLASSNLLNWVPISIFTVSNNPTLLTDNSAQAFSRRLYRIGPLSSVPAPRLAFNSSKPFSGNGLGLNLQGFAGLNYRILTSSNLLNWTAFTNVLSTNSITPFNDPGASNRPNSFYRAVVP